MRRYLSLLVLALAVQSCELIGNIIHDDQKVAKVDDRKLYLSEVEAVIPNYMSAADSAELADKYINTWASEILYTRMAEEYLSKQEKDVTAELEAYRQSLLKFRYEQHYINDRLDTLITQKQIQEYFETHQDLFVLERPVVKYLFVEVGEKSPYLKDIEELLTSHMQSDRQLLDSLSYVSTSRLVDCSAQWTDVSVLAKEYGMNYPELLSLARKSVIKVSDKDRGTVKITFLCDAVNSGIAPLEFCNEQIKELILSTRKRELLSGLEQGLLESARKSKRFVIY